jgi:hypothetical protein
MKKETSLWLELLALVFLLFIIVWLGFDQDDASIDRLHATAHAMSEAKLLGGQLDALEEKATHYLDNAPRDYDNYFRDAEIAGPYLTTEVGLIDHGMGQLFSLGGDPMENARAQAAMNDSGLGELPIDTLQREWLAFEQKLDEQLGVDPEMPRLEWGYRHIAEEISSVRHALSAIESQARERLESSRPALAASSSRPGWAWPAILVWVLGMLTWFGLRVNRVGARD